jgi:hypothetical protein
MRKGIPDLLKGTAIILMIQVHIMELFAMPVTYDGLAGRISLFMGGAPVAPVFMAVMGYFLYAPSKRLSYYYTRGLRLLLVAFLLNIGLNFHLLLKIIGGTIRLNPYDYLFGVDILFLAALSMMIIGVLRLAFKEHVMLYILLALVVAAARYAQPAHPPAGMVIKYLVSYVWGPMPWSYFPLIPWLSYPLAGYAYHILEERYKVNVGRLLLKRIIAVIAILALLITIHYAIEVSTDLQKYYHHPLPFFVWVIIFLAAWGLMFQVVEQYSGNTKIVLWIKWMGRHVTAMYVVQWLIIGNIATAVYKTEPAWTLPVWFAAITAGSNLIVLAWVKIRQSRHRRKLI